MKKFLLAALMLAVPVAAQGPELFVSGDSTVERVGLPDESPARFPRGRVSPGPEQRNARIGFYNHVDGKGTASSTAYIAMAPTAGISTRTATVFNTVAAGNFKTA